MAHGGKRIGAGRKPLPKSQKMVNVSVMLSPSLIKELSKAVKESGLTRSAYVANAIYRSIK